MKRFFLFVAVAMTAATTFAQKVAVDKSQLVPVSAQQIQKWQGATTALTPVADKMTIAKAPATRSASTGVYYYKPEGSLYWCYFDNDPTSSYYGSYYYNTMIAVAAWDAFTFTNMSTNPTSCSWAINGTDYSDYADSEGNFTMYHYYPDYGYTCPTVSNSSDSYTMGYYASSGYSPAAYAFSDLQWLGFLDNKAYYLWGSFDNDNIAGTGTLTSGGYTYTCTDVVAEYPAPASPLYVEDIYILGDVIGASAKPLNNGATLTMYIYNSQTGELLETLTATDNDSDWYSWYTSTRNSKYVQLGALRFSKKVEDVLFGEMEEPFVIDCPTTIYISGFEDGDINFGVAGNAVNDCDNTTASTVGEDAGTWQSSILYMLLLGPDGNYYSMGYSGICLNAMFNGIMDKIQAADEIVFGDETTVENSNVLVISDDGKTCSVYGAPSSSYDLEAIFAETASTWYDGDGNENYGLAETPDWITGLIVDTQYYDPDEYIYYNLVSFEAEALPTGTTGRSAKVYLQGRGYTDDMPIILIQGNVSLEEAGIHNITADNASTTGKSYTIAGQRASKTFKGITIQDGKKYLNK